MPTDEELKKLQADLLKSQIRESNLRVEAIKKSTMCGGAAQVTGGCACWRGQLCDFHNEMYHGKS